MDTRDYGLADIAARLGLGEIAVPLDMFQSRIEAIDANGLLSDSHLEVREIDFDVTETLFDVADILTDRIKRPSDMT